MRKLAFIALLLPFFASAEWVDAPNSCFVPDADHELVMIDLVPRAHGRYAPIKLETSGVPADAKYVEFEGETAVERTGRGNCAVWVGMAGADSAPDQAPYLYIQGNEVEKTQSWHLRAVPHGGVVSVRVMRTVSGPAVNCGMSVIMSVSKWCR